MSSQAAAGECVGCGRPLEQRRCVHCGAAAYAGPYRTLRVMGHGARGRLYLAQAADGECVALREFVIQPDPAALESFERGAKQLTQLSHPAIPRISGSFIEAGDEARYYLAQQFVEGESLLD